MPPQDLQNEDDSAEQTPPGGRFARLLGLPKRAVGWSLAHRWRAALIGLACLASLGGVVAGRWLLAPRAPVTPKLTSEMVFRVLKQGDYAEAKKQAEQLRRQPLATEEMIAAAPFILNSITSLERVSA